MKKIVFFTVLILATFSMVHSIQSMVALWQKRDIILQTRQGVQKEQEENKKLKQQLQIVSQPSFVDEEARNKLFMVKPGEEAVFIPQDALASSSSQLPEASAQLSNWQQWLQLFFF